MFLNFPGCCVVPRMGVAAGTRCAIFSIDTIQIHLRGLWSRSFFFLIWLYLIESLRISSKNILFLLVAGDTIKTKKSEVIKDGLKRLNRFQHETKASRSLRSVDKDEL